MFKTFVLHIINLLHALVASVEEATVKLKAKFILCMLLNT